MVKRKFDKNQTKLGIKTLDWNVLKNHISRFVIDFIVDVFLLLEIDESKKKRDFTSRFNVKITYL